MNGPDDPNVELERRYRRLLRLFPAYYRRAWEQELLAVLMQNAAPRQRRPEPVEVTALLWQAGESVVPHRSLARSDRKPSGRGDPVGHPAAVAAVPGR